MLHFHPLGQQYPNWPYYVVDPLDKDGKLLSFVTGGGPSGAIPPAGSGDTKVLTFGRVLAANV